MLNTGTQLHYYSISIMTDYSIMLVASVILSINWVLAVMREKVIKLRG